MSALVAAARDLTRRALDAAAGTASETPLADALTRLDGPLRVAVAGKVKAGKSTLLNALVGDELAPTDAGECTRIVTWYRQGLTYRVRALHRASEAPFDLPFARDGGPIEVDLGGYTPAEIVWLDVEWPSSALADLTLVDTPGLESLSRDVSERATAFLAPADETPRAADAVVYLMRHVHSEDVAFLEAFHDDAMAQATPVNAIGVLSRADEIGAGRTDAMGSAARIAARYRSEPKLRRLCQTVLPVAGLLAEAGATLREAEFAALRTIAALPTDVREPLLLSVDRFSAEAVPVRVTAEERRELLERLGMFGLRVSIGLIESQEVVSAPQLARELVARSGLRELQQALRTQFAARAGLLKARSALLSVEAALRRGDLSGGTIATDLERVVAGAHELNEIRLLNAMRSGAIGFTDAETEAAETLLGAHGAGVEARLRLDAGADPASVQAAALEALAVWQARAESPMSSRDTADAARVLVRTCEGILAGT